MTIIKEQQGTIVSVRANTGKLIQTLRMVKAAVGKRSSKAISVSTEITVTDDKITFAVPGAIFSLECITQGTCKASVPFLHFLQIIKDSKAKETDITITEGSLKINSVTISVRTTFIEDDSILRTIDLPINYTEADLIRLSHNGYTYEELEFNNLHFKIDDAMLNLSDNTFKAYSLLKQYGIDYAELKKMVNDKLFSKTLKHI